jgi:hypothetical protein
MLFGVALLGNEVWFFFDPVFSVLPWIIEGSGGFTGGVEFSVSNTDTVLIRGIGYTASMSDPSNIEILAFGGEISYNRYFKEVFNGGYVGVSLGYSLITYKLNDTSLNIHAPVFGGSLGYKIRFNHVYINPYMDYSYYFLIWDESDLEEDISLPNIFMEGFGFGINLGVQF